MSKKTPVSKASREVWAWKDVSYCEVAHLPSREALRELIRRAQAESRELGFTPTKPTKPAMVAESRTKYRPKR
ncbi:MAG TPA: hypothetical protein VLZ30_08765 [Verrucomicrobiae bacterium]|nr:hypothetical protein [Verrucomicrobiae bacterium]